MQFLISTFVFLNLLFAPLLATAQFHVPPLTGPVVDEAGLFSSDQSQALSQALKSIHNSGGPQINVLTVPTLNGLSIEEASMRVAQDWKLGTSEKDNGALLVVAINDRKVRIEVGQGLEGDLTDAYSKRIIDYDIIPYFKQGQYGLGIIKGVQGILLHMDPPIQLTDHISGDQLHQNLDSKNSTSYYVFLFILIVLSLIISVFFNGGGRRRGYGGYYGGGGGFGGGSGGGWSGGGGGFSGGGASGSW